MSLQLGNIFIDTIQFLRILMKRGYDVRLVQRIGQTNSERMATLLLDGKLDTKLWPVFQIDRRGLNNLLHRSWCWWHNHGSWCWHNGFRLTSESVGHAQRGFPDESIVANLCAGNTINTSIMLPDHVITQLNSPRRMDIEAQSKITTQSEGECLVMSWSNRLTRLAVN